MRFWTGTAFTPIVNPPEVAILGLTRTEQVPVWENDAVVPVPMGPLDLSYDHRMINGADAARFLSHYARMLADLRRLLVGFLHGAVVPVDGGWLAR